MTLLVRGARRPRVSSSPRPGDDRTDIDPVTRYALDVVAGEIVAGPYVRLTARRHLADIENGSARGLRFNRQEAERAIAFYPAAMTHWKGEWAGQRVVLEPWECFIVGSAFGWQRFDTSRGRWLRRFRLVYIEIAKKNGKAVALDTPIPTPSGWTTMGELRVGDQVLDANGQPTTVTFATDVMRGHPCYRVRFSDGTSVVADADHQWETEELRHRYRASVKTTADIAASIAVRRDGARNHRIPVAAPLDLPAADLPLDPYVLGVWLGDGDSGAAVITVGDEDVELLDLVASAGVAVHRKPASHRTARFRLGSDGTPRSRSETSSVLRALGVMGNKHVPPAFLRSSIDQRLALLQGLMDTDGSVAVDGQCEFTTTRPALRDGFLELARSLGYKPVAHEGIATLRGREIGPKWRIQFHGDRARPPFRLARKALRVRAAASQARSRHRMIVAADPVPSVAVRCIQVDAPSHLFLVGAGMIPTHNTLLGAGFGLRLAFFDGEPGGEVYSCATKRDQAKFVWNDARRAVRRNPGLRRRIQIADSTSTLYDTLSGSKFEPLGRDSDTDQGINPNGAVLDELHVHRDRTLFDNVGTAMAARAQPMRVVITTAGVRRESIWWEVRTDVVRILDGRAEDDSVFGFVACLHDEDDPFDEGVWPKANPNLGISVGVDFLREQAAKAKRSPGERTSYMRFHMNMPTTSSTGAIDIADWDACDEPAQIVPGDVGYGGLDLAQLADLTALVKVFVRSDGYVDVASHFWCPAAAIDERSRLDGVPYRQWADEGWITVTPGDVTDFAFVRQTLLALPEQILEFGYDRWQAMQLALELQQDGAVMVPISQTTAGLAAGWHEIERLIAERKFRFDGNPVLRWMAGNVEVEEDAAGNRKPSKRASRERIDGMVAFDMAIARALANPPPPDWRMA